MSKLPIGHYYSTLLTLGLLAGSIARGLGDHSQLTTSLLLIPLPLYFFRRSLKLTRLHLRRQSLATRETPRFPLSFYSTITLFVIAIALTLLRSLATVTLAHGGSL